MNRIKYAVVGIKIGTGGRTEALEIGKKNY